MVYLSDHVDPLRTQGASGKLTPMKALEHLLSGTGLSYRHLDESTVTVFRADAATGGAAVDSATSARSDDSGERGRGKKGFWDRFRSRRQHHPASLALAAADQESSASNSGQETRAQPERLEEVIVTANKREERLRDGCAHQRRHRLAAAGHGRAESR